MALVMDIVNHTRTYYNCGFSPYAINKILSSRTTSRFPKTIVPMSSAAADLMAQMKPDMEKLGLNIDINATASFANGKDKNGKKIYPNDPCPCGSGKKYKKCCGSK